MFHSILSAILTTPETSNLPAWLAAALAAYTAGTLSKKQRRKLKWKLAWQFAKSKLTFAKKGKEKTNKGLLIVSIILALGCFGLAIWLGMLKEFLILIGALVLFFILFASAFKRQNGISK